jgi:hypothetical protein
MHRAPKQRFDIRLQCWLSGHWPARFRGMTLRHIHTATSAAVNAEKGKS